MNDDISPELEQALDSNVAWVLETLNAYDQHGHPAMKEAIAQLTDEEKDSIIRVLLCIQHGQVSEIRKQIREGIAKQRFDGLGGNPTLN